MQFTPLEPAHEWPRTGPAEPTWTQRVGGFTVLPAIIRQLGGDADVALHRAGLAADALDGAERRIPYIALARLFDEAVAQTGCAHFGLLAGRAWCLSDLGLLGDVVRNTPLVGTALDALTAYQHINSEGGLAYVKERGGVVDFGYAVYHPDVIDPVQLYGAVLACDYNFMRELAGPDWRPTEVLLPHAKPADATPYRNFFKVQPRFDCEIGALRFPAHWLERSVEGADAGVRHLAEERVKSAPPPEFLQQVYRTLRRLFLDDRHSGDDVARTLAMHRRTLNRRLHEQGTTYQQLLDHARHDLARQLLATSDVPLDDIAATLGYAGVSPFMRTFRRWSGETPGRWRRSAKKMLAAEHLPHSHDVERHPAPPGRDARHAHAEPHSRGRERSAPDAGRARIAGKGGAAE